MFHHFADFGRLGEQGFLLLNASLVLTDNNPRVDANAWLPFMAKLLECLSDRDITLILFGNIAKRINALTHARNFKHMQAEHPYNISFINNPEVLSFFKGFHLLRSGFPPSRE